MAKNQFLYWEMENGHQHSYVAIECEDVLNEFATINKKGELTQEQYREYVAEHERTHVLDQVIETFEGDITEELAQKWEDEDMVAGFEVDEFGVLVEFY